MQSPVYKEAVAELAIPKLTEFLKLTSDYVEIEGWAKMRAPAKRENILDALSQSKELRKEFVTFYAEKTGNEADWSEWETADLPDEGDKPEEFDPPTGTAAATEAAAPQDQEPTAISSEAVTLGTSKPSTFVEGAFEQIASDVAGLDAVQSRTNLKEAEETLEFEHIRIGALLSHIQASQHYVTLGYDNLREFLAAETAMDYRKGTYLISNFNKVRDLGIPTNMLKGVTWSALRHIVPVLTAENYKTWLAAARSNTHVSLIAQVEQQKAENAGALPPPNEDGTQAPAAQPTSKVFNVYPDQGAIISAALEKAKTEGNVDSNGAALEIIASAYSGQPASTNTIAAVLPDMSKDGFLKMFSKLKADAGVDGLVPVLEAIGEIWPDVDITVEFPKGENQDAAE